MADGVSSLGRPDKRFGSRATTDYAKKRISKLTDRVAYAENAHPDTIIHGKKAADRARLDKITLKRWQDRHAEYEQKESEPEFAFK